jgi:hypothetical protein
MTRLERRSADAVTNLKQGVDRDRAGFYDNGTPKHYEYFETPSRGPHRSRSV